MLLMPEPGSTLTKDPDASLVYGMEWSRYLPEDVELASSAWLIDGEDAALTQSSAAYEGTRATVRLTAGTEGVIYTVTNRVTYGSPVQTDDRSFNLRIRER